MEELSGNLLYGRHCSGLSILAHFRRSQCLGAVNDYGSVLFRDSYQGIYCCLAYIIKDLVSYISG